MSSKIKHRLCFRYFRRRSEVEKEYTKHMRALLAEFWPKENKKNTAEESTLIKNFRLGPEAEFMNVQFR